MSTERKLLIGAGALLLVLMTGIIAFSLGVYVGSKGWLTQPTITAQRTNIATVQQDRVQAEPAERPALTGLLVNGNRARCLPCARKMVHARWKSTKTWS